MATFLHHVGALSARRWKTVLATWLLVLVSAGTAAAVLAEPFGAGFRIPGTESQRALDAIEASAPSADVDGASGRVVFAAPEGRTLDTGAARAAVDRTVTAVRRVPGVASASDPYRSGGLSDDRGIAYTDVLFAVAEQDLSTVQTNGIDRAVQPARDAGLRVELGGATVPAPAEAPLGEALGVAVAVLVLAITFRSLLAAALTLLASLFGVAVGIAGIFLATAFTALSDTALTLTLMLGLAVGIDYALLILTRHRSQVRAGMPIGPSIARAVATAGSAVVFAGATVVLALVALVVTGIPFVQQMGLAAAGTVAVAVAVSLTLLPALLAAVGPRAVRGYDSPGRDAATRGAGATTVGTRWIGLVLRRPLLAIALPVTALALVAIPALDMRLALPGEGALSPATTQRQAHDLLAEGFGPGSNGPLTIVAELPSGSGAQRAADAAAAELTRFDGVAAVSPALLGPGGLALIQVTPTTGPSDAATTALVETIRRARGDIEKDTGAAIAVTGQTAVEIDASQKMGDALVPYLAVVTGLALLLLLLAFRSVLVPLVAIAGFLLTTAATFGAVVAVFQHGFAASLLGVEQTAPLASVLPILILGVLFGLAMDYQVFLTSRMREQIELGAGPRDAVRDGFRSSARVVTAAALIMTAVFTGFILPDEPIIKSVGFAFAFGVLVDAFLVRMTLVPALLLVLGRHAWWLPGWLDRALPDVDLDGASLDAPEIDSNVPPTRAPEQLAGRS